jgi:hypothetical protein
MQWNNTFSVVNRVTAVLSMHKLEGVQESVNTSPFARHYEYVVVNGHIYVPAALHPGVEPPVTNLPEV